MLDDNMPYRRIIDPEPYYPPHTQQDVLSAKENIMQKENPDDVTTKSPKSISERIVVNDLTDEALVLLPLSEARNRINLRPDMAKVWVDEFVLNELAGYDLYFLERELELLDNPKLKPIRDALNFYFFPINSELLRQIFYIMEADEHVHIPEESRMLLEDVKRVISLFPDLESRLGFTENSNRLLKLPEVARLLSVSESKVRKLVSDGLIEHTKSQGETGHYRFTRSAVREYVESSKVG